MIDVTTTLEEETYPSNAQMVTRIGHYLKTGDGYDSLDIFRNLLSAYENSTENLLYTFTDLTDLIATLESRNKSVIDSKIKELLNKNNIKDTP